MTESPGKLLKRERETRKISLEEISYFTKIKERHLKAIEEDKYEFLPPALYVKGYLNVFARYLNLDPKEIILQYENYLKSLTPPEPIGVQHQVLPPRKRVRPWFFLSLIFVAFFLTLFLISYPGRHSLEKKPKTISFSSISPSPAIQQEVKAQTIHPARQEGLSEPEKIEVNLSTPRAEGQALPSTRETPLTPSRSQAEGSASLPQARVDPERRSSTPFSKTGLVAVEWVNDAAAQQVPAFQVLEASIGRGIEKEGGRQSLTGKCSEFASNNQRAYFFTRVKTPVARKITHIWLWEGTEYYQMEIDVKPPAWSVYSYCTFRPQHTGSWRAEARDGDQVLSSLDFRVVQSTGDRSL